MMSPRTLLAIALACSPGLAAPQDPSPAAIGQPTPAPILDGSQDHGLPGTRPGTERWIVHFATRSFDLAALRAAIAARAVATVADLVQDLEARVQVDQRAFVDAVQGLGGRVDQQWWLVNAAVVEIDPAQLDAMRLLPNVAFVEADQLHEPDIRTSTNSSNHNADALQAQGFDGQGATVAVIDTGHDSNMGGSGRPHRMYFVNGDTTNLTGGGIGGSRLRVNRQIGSQPADDIDGHGTSVDSIVAGANWGLAIADDGHAPLASIAGYAIADNASGSSASSTITTAWQTMTADVAAFNIVSANMSFSGSTNPLTASNQAMDTAALTGDVLYSVSAGNTGGQSNSSNAACNGLAVAAITTNTHSVAGFSSRGPVITDPTRTYPDISGCGVNTVMAARDNEGAAVVASGTSMASPMVAGAAVQLRARFPNLTALETKAALLASAEDIAAQNPGLGVNDYGMGMLRNDRVHSLVAVGSFGSAFASVATPHTFALQAQAGREYHVAVAWNRRNVGSTTWSDLNLEVLDAASTVIASSTSPRNLYEVVSFTAPATGTLTIRTRAVSVSQGISEPFAYALLAEPLPAATSTFGSGCAPICAGINEAGGTLAPQVLASEVAYDMTAPTALTLTSVDVFTSSTTGSLASLLCSIYLDSGGTIATTRIAASGMGVGPTPGWYRATFSVPVAVPAGPFWISLAHSTATNLSNLTAGTVGGSFERTTLFSGPWTRSTMTLRPAFRVHCNLPGAGGQPLLTASSRPLIGTTMALNCNNVAANTVTFLGLGTSNSLSALGPLPLPLDLLGATGCELLISTDIGLNFALADGSGLASSGLSIPANSLFSGLHVYAQFFAAAPGANPMGLTVSNAFDLLLGDI